MSYREALPADIRPRVSFEWPTWALIAAIYGAWLGLILVYPRWPTWLTNPALVVVTAWYMSLQHELLHGHPTRHPGLNRLLGLLPLSAWYPYDIYRDSHMVHHRDELLTTPGADPESNYVHATDHARMNGLQRWLHVSQRTVLGRFLVGPGYMIALVWADLVTGPRQRGWRAVKTWSVHLLLLLAVLAWVYRAAGISPLHYLFGIAYPALGLAMLRSFLEHRPAKLAAHRIVINEAGAFWRLLYLNNNLHAVHHHQPSLAWYRIPAAYRDNRAAYRRANGGFFLQGYLPLIWKHAVTPVDSSVHPGFD